MDEKKEFGKASDRKKALEQLLSMTAPLREEGMFVSTLAVESNEFLQGAITVTQTLTGLALPPNVLFVRLGVDHDKDGALKSLILMAESMGLGIIIFRFHPKVAFGQKQVINLWIRRGSPNIHLGILIGLQLESNWEVALRLIQVASDDKEKEEAQSYLNKLKKLMRLPNETEVVVLGNSFDEAVAVAPLADINIFGLPKELDLLFIRGVSDKVNTSVLFLKDSYQENAIA